MIRPPQKATRNQLKTHNERLILKTIYNYPQTSRADLARMTKLTRPTVSNIVADLIKEGMVEEVGQGPSAGGKPPTLLSLVGDSRHLIGLDLSNSEFRGAVINLRGDVRHRTALSARGAAGDDALNLVYQLIDPLIEASQSPILGIGLGTPGIINPNKGVVQQAVNLGWYDLALRNLLQKRYQVPVYITNDSHAAALGEYTFGDIEKTGNLAVIKVGRGIGAGLILNGHLFYGDGFGAGEIGHIVVADRGERCTCGNYGCLETVASSRALTQQAALIAQTEPQSGLRELAATSEQITVDLILQAFQAGDTTLLPLIAEAGRYLGIAIANLVGALNLHCVLIAGSLARFGETLLLPIREEIRRRVLPAFANQTQVEIAGSGADIVILGAAALLLTHELGVV